MPKKGAGPTKGGARVKTWSLFGEANRGQAVQAGGFE